MSNTIYYVYIYKDPITKLPFYIGKGSGSRAYVHLNETKEKNSNYLKWCKLESIRKQGLTPIIEIFMCTKDEDYAYDVESDLILKYGRKAFGEGILTNLCTDNRPPSYAPKLPRSSEYLKNMSIAKRGNKNPMFGKSPWNKNNPGYSTSKKGQRRKWINNGKTTKQILLEEETPSGWVPGRINCVRTTKKDYVKKSWMNNGIKSKMHPKNQQLPEGWVWGRMIAAKN